MDVKKGSGMNSRKYETTMERRSERELVVTRTFNGPVHIVFDAWTKPELFRRWWMPKSCGASMISCDLDVRTGGTYRLVMGHPSFEQPMAFFGRYVEVIPPSRIVWTNDEGGEGGVVSLVLFVVWGGVSFVSLFVLFFSLLAFEPQGTIYEVASCDEDNSRLV